MKRIVLFFLLMMFIILGQSGKSIAEEGTLWTASLGGSGQQVAKYGPAGAELFKNTNFGGNPTDVAIDPVNNKIWVSASGGAGTWGFRSRARFSPDT